MKKAQFRYEDFYKSGAESVSDRIFMCFVFGWFVGLLAGTVYAGFHWDNLHSAMGTALVIAVSVALLFSYWLCCRAMRRIIPQRQKRQSA